MKKILISLAFIANVACSQSFIRTHTIISDNSTFPTPANVEWMQGESVRFEITAKSGNFYIPLSNGVAPVLKMWSGNIITQLYAQKTGTIYSAGSGKLYVDLLANEANISPSGAYNYAVGVYDGTQYMGVVAQGRATVRAHPFGSSVGYVGAFNAFPYVPTNDANYLGGITGAVAGANVSIARTGRTVYISATSGGGSGMFTNMQWGTNNNTAQALIRAESNIVFRSAGGTNYAALAGNLTGDFTFGGAINANDNIEIANTKHLRFQDGGGTNTVHLAATAGRLIITGAVDIVTGQAVPATINGAQIATASDVSARLASNVWATADSTTNYYQSISLGGGYNFSLEITNKGGAYFLNDTNRSLSRYEGGVVTGPFTNIFSITTGRQGGGDAWNGLFRMWWDIQPAYVELSPNAAGTYPLGLSLDGGAQHPIWSSYYQGTGTGMDSDLLDGLNSSAFFQSIRTNGSGNVVTNLTFGGSVITQQMGTVSGGGGAAAISNAFVHFNLGAARNATNNGMGLARGYLDTDTATNDIFPAFFVTVSSNVVQDAYAKAWIRWPVANPTQIQLRVWYQGNTNNPLEARFSNGTNAVAYVLGAASADALNTITLTPSGFLTNVVENAAVQLRISAAFASTSSVPMGRGIEEGIWVRR